MESDVPEESGGRRFLERARKSAVAWLGLAWVYSGALWLLAAFWIARSGDPAVSIAGVLRLGATLVIGAALCAGERWAWAVAMCLCVAEGVLLTPLALLAGRAWLGAPGPLPPWQPVFLGLNASSTLGLAAGGLAAALASAVGLVVLWRAQGQFDVPYRRPFTTLTRLGSAPALAVLALDLFLFGSVRSWIQVG